MFQYIPKLEKLQSLRLGENFIKAPGAIKLLNSLVQSKTIKYLDLKWNNIGAFIPSPGKLAQALSNLFKAGVIWHLDISYNQINHLECYKLGTLIKDNHSVIGLHMNGNEGYLDPLGFIHSVYNDYKEIEEHKI